MKIRTLLVCLCLCCVYPSGEAAELEPGAVYVFFEDISFQRPGKQSIGMKIKNRGREEQVKAYGVDKQIYIEIEGINDFSKLWLGYIKFPVSGEVTFFAEADDGIRLFIDGKPVIDGWSRDGARQGHIRGSAGQTFPLRVEYFQYGGESYLRLYWQWKGHPREIIPPSAFWYSEKELKLARAIIEGKMSVAPGNAPPVISAPRGDEAIKSSIYQPSSGKERRSSKPIQLRPGVHLFIDDFLIESSRNVKRRVNCPQRDPEIHNPIITGKEDRSFQPYMTILRDLQTKRFRIWYNAYRDDHTTGFGYMESDDGIHWIRPHRVLNDPAPIQFGVSVIDDGPDLPDRSKRYKIAWWKDGGLKIAVSPDGLNWTPLARYVVLRHNHDINNIFYDPLRKRYVATVSVYTTGPTWKTPRRTTMMSTSDNLLNWAKPWYVVTADDSIDEGQTQFYAMNGYLFRGDLCIGLVKVLRDDLVAPNTPKGAYGIGYTTLAWSRDGEHWVRDTTPFFEPNPDPNAWDHAHAWLDYQLLVGDEVYIYYGGYKYGHKMDRWTGRQIGLVRMKRDRYVSRDADASGGTLLTPLMILAGNKMTINADVNGELRVRLLDNTGKPVPGFDADDCKPIKGDSLAHPVGWKASLTTLQDKPVRVEFTLRDAKLYAFDLFE